MVAIGILDTNTTEYFKDLRRHLCLLDLELL